VINPSEPQFRWWEDGTEALLDQIICSCGWKSATFFDGQEYAYAQWKRHIKESHMVSNRYTMPSADKYLISVSPDGRIRKEAIEKAPDFKVLNKIVGGYIELIPYFTKYDGHPCVAFCNEEGKLPHHKLPFNKFAQGLWEKAVGRPITEDYLVGTIAIITGSQTFLSTL
jgi:Domain of unknown function (DUF3846)